MFIASHQPIIIFLPVDPYVDELIVSCCFFLAMTGAMVSYFGNKMYLLAIGADLNAQFKLVYKTGGPTEVVDQADVLRRASEFDINNSLKIPDHEKAAFYDNEIPSDVTTEYCLRRAALWQQFRHEMEARLLTDVPQRSSAQNLVDLASTITAAVLKKSTKSSGEGERERSGVEGSLESSRLSRVAAVEELRLSLGGRANRSQSRLSSVGLTSERVYSGHMDSGHLDTDVEGGATGPLKTTSKASDSVSVVEEFIAPECTPRLRK